MFQKIILLICFTNSSIALLAQNYQFDFGEGKTTAKGFTKVTPQTIFNYTTGFGFSKTDTVKAVARKGKNPVTNDFITSTKPFFFSVQLPEGNYDVKVTLGDIAGESATTVRAECRRLFLQNVQTKKGEVLTKTFTVHVKDSLIRDAAGKVLYKVKLKQREYEYRHWDNLLTLEFNDTAAKVCAVEITPNKKAATIFLAGNSTVVDQDREPWAAWGQMFPSFFEAKNICVANYAESGETLKGFKGARRVDKIFSMAKPGDYLFIEFAHNDQKPGGNHLDPFTTYTATLKEWIADAKKHAITPVLVTSMHRRNFDAAGKILNTLLEYPDAMRKLAKDENILLIDLNAMSKTLYEAWGPTTSLKAFVHYPANSFPGQDKAIADNTHFSTYGAYELARCVVQSIKEQQLPFAKYLRKDIGNFNPAQPDQLENWYWPLSILQPAVKPDGN